MTNKNNIIAAVDVGTTKIVALIAQILENGELQILGLGHEKSCGVRRGIVLNIDETVKGIKAAVQSAEQQANVKISNVYVGIAGQHIRSMITRGYLIREKPHEEIKKDELVTLMKKMRATPVNPGEEILHVLPQDYMVDNEMGIRYPVGIAGKKLEANFHLVVGDTEAANQLKKCIIKSGLCVNSVFLEPLASSYAVLSEDEKELGVALVEIGGGTTDIAVYVDKHLQHSAIIPLAGNIVTEDLKKGLNVLERDAELIKINFGYAIWDDVTLKNKAISIAGISGRPPREIEFCKIAEIIQARMAEIIEDVLFHLTSTGLRKKLGAGIVVTGGGAMLNNLTQLIAYICECDVRLRYPQIAVADSCTIDITNPIYSTCVGLLVYGLEEMNNKEEPTLATELTPDEHKAIEEPEPIIEKPKRKKRFDLFGEKIKTLFEGTFNFDVNNDDMNNKTE